MLRGTIEKATRDGEQNTSPPYLMKTYTPPRPARRIGERGVLVSAYPTLPPACLPTPNRMDATSLAPPTALPNPSPACRLPCSLACQLAIEREKKTPRPSCRGNGEKKRADGGNETNGRDDERRANETVHATERRRMRRQRGRDETTRQDDDGRDDNLLSD